MATVGNLRIRLFAVIYSVICRNINSCSLYVVGRRLKNKVVYRLNFGMSVGFTVKVCCKNTAAM